MKTRQTNYIIKVREEAILKKVGRREAWFRGARDHGYYRGDGPMVTEKGDTERTHNT